MATRDQIKAALRVDDAAKSRQAMTRDDRNPRFYGNGLPKFVEKVPAVDAELLSRVMTPATLKD